MIVGYHMIVVTVDTIFWWANAEIAIAGTGNCQGI